MPKIEAGDEKFWLLDGVPQQRGMWKILTFGDNVELKPIGEPTLGSSTGSVKFDQYTNAVDAPYATLQALIDDLKAFFFRSVAGAGGGVQTVTGDGVSGTATDVVLTFPDADQVDDGTTTNKFATEGQLNQIGTNTTDIGTNTTDIGTNTTDIGTNATDISNHVEDGNNPHGTTVTNLTDTQLTALSNGEVLTWNGSNWVNSASTGFDPATSKVLTDFNYNQGTNTAISNSEPPNLTTYLTLIVGGLDISALYKFTCHFSIAHDATNSNAVVDIKDFGTSILTQVYTVEPKDTNDRKWEGIEGVIPMNPLGGGQFQLQLDFGTDDNDDDTTMYFGFLSIQKIN